MRYFDYARKIGENGAIDGTKAFENAKIPVYMSVDAAGADFYCAEDVKIRSFKVAGHKPVLVHTGIKACMNEGEYLMICNRSSSPKNGLILANGVGIIDKDYFENKDNDGEIMFAFINDSDVDVELKAGDRIGQGIFMNYLRPDMNLEVEDSERSGGFGSTGK